MRLICSAFVVISFASSFQAFAQLGSSDDYLTWSLKEAETIGRSTRKSANSSASAPAIRVMSTDRATFYQIRATLFTPEVLRASARFHQINNRLTNDQTRTLIAEAEASGDLVAMIEIDPAEGSGVVPLDWRVFLEKDGYVIGFEGAVAGIKSPELRRSPLFQGVFKRDYEYDVFWVRFPLLNENKKLIFDESASSMILTVGIYKSEARVSWPITPALRARIRSLSK